jgi:hypothetical protein
MDMTIRASGSPKGQLRPAAEAAIILEAAEAAIILEATVQGGMA